MSNQRVLDEFAKAASTMSDINEHVPTLSKYAEECESVVEFGVRAGVSTWGFAHGLIQNTLKNKPCRLDGFDLGPAPVPYSFLKDAGIPYLTCSFTQENNLHVAPVECDLLFIDTFHVYGQLKRELERHASGVRKYIILHDTTVDEYEGELRRVGWNAVTMSARTGIPVGELLIGLWPAVELFLARHSEWQIKERFANNNGLTVLQRRPGSIARVPTFYTTKPIGFAIPACKIVSDVPSKHKMFGTIVPGDMSTYIFSEEASYYADYQQSVFGRTCKKAGWDCLRHYEILANGCIPFFIQLDQCPSMTMTHFPKAIVMDAMKQLVHASEDDPAVTSFTKQLLDFTRARLTTEAMASWVLVTTGHIGAKSVLYLSGDVAPDYLRCLLLHGFKEIFKKNCHDFPQISHLYTDCGEIDRLYGRGFSYTRLLSKSDSRDAERDATIESDIRSRRYDVIVYGSVHRGMPFWDLVNENYDKNEILLFCGEDLHQCSLRTRFCNYHFFCRELSM